MKHLLMDPRFPDIVGEAAMEEEFRELATAWSVTGPDAEGAHDISEEIIIAAAMANLERTRAW